MTPPQPEPIPTHFNAGAVVTENYRGVALEVFTATGRAVYFMPPHVADGLSAHLGNASRLAKETPLASKPSGLIVPDVDMSQVVKHLKGNGKSA